MERREQRGGNHAGGIEGLAEIVSDHGGALDYDLMTMTPYTLDDLGGRLSCKSLIHFIRHLSPTSATKRSLDGGITDEQAGWMGGEATALLIACLIDEIRGLEWLYQSAHSKTRIRRPKRFPTPWSTDEELGVRRIGKDPIRVGDFDVWFDNKDSQGEEG